MQPKRAHRGTVDVHAAERRANLGPRDARTGEWAYNGKACWLDGTHYTAPNDYVATASQLAAFRDFKMSFGQTVTQMDPYLS
ncbi:MAG TPA: hypothetical protein VHM72_03285 [Solirubrobacteraceae bacterium]|jgi:hypothetical protein|nr:hypothetical protein [Solirubrobacteraceae bacterium]